MTLERIPQISHAPVTVVGAARSGLAAAQLLAARGARVFLTERSPERLDAGALARLSAAGVESEWGIHSARALEADFLVVSPGVSSQSEIVRSAIAAGIPVVSEIEAASWFCPLPIVAITGTNGKTTTTALAGQIFRDAGWKTMVAGNIGNAFADAIATLPREGVVVLEVSSYQLDHIHLFHPRVAVLTNITPDHLDRYAGRMEDYIASKRRIWMNQTPDDALIYGADDPTTAAAVAEARSARLFPCSTARRLEQGAYLEGDALLLRNGDAPELIARTGEMILRGAHNHANALMAALAARLLGVPADRIGRSCRSFAGVEHRLEFVRAVGGVGYVNDSKATNVESVVIALRSFPEPVILIAGGRDKGAPYDPLFPLVRAGVKEMILIGEAADRMASAFEGMTRISRAATLEEAVQAAHARAASGDVVLLSPACASFDMFRDFEERGRAFREAVRNLPEAGGKK